MSGPFTDPSWSQPQLSAAPAEGKPLTVLQLVGAHRMGGAEQATLEVARAVIAAGGRALIAGAGAMTPRLRVAGGETFQFQPETGMFRRGKSGAALADLIRAAGVDVIHARAAEMAAPGKAASAALGAGFVTTLHDAPSAAWLKAAGDRALIEADRVIAVSSHVAGHVASDRVIAIPRGADMNVFAEEVVSPTRTIALAEAWGLTEEVRPIILAPGRIDPSNGQEVLIDAAARLRGKRGEDFLLLIVGRGEEEQVDALSARAVKAGLGGLVRIAGPTEDMPAALKLSAVIVSAATAPPAAGRTMIEAQAMGRPVIAPDHGAMSEVVGGGETGWLLPPGDADMLADAMDQALNMDESQRAHIGLAGRARVRARFTLEGMLTRILGVYEEVADRPFRPSVI